MVAICCLALICLPACHSSEARRQQLVSPYPLDRVQAAVRLAEAGDEQAVDLLIELLADRDRAVRMYAILALERLCGETYGYRYYDPEPGRAASIARWRDARQQGKLTVRARPSQRTEPGAGRVPELDGSEEQSP